MLILYHHRQYARGIEHTLGNTAESLAITQVLTSDVSALIWLAYSFLYFLMREVQEHSIAIYQDMILSACS